MNRQIFFAGMGGFDNHEDLVNRHAGAAWRRSTRAVGAFFTTLDARGMTNEVTLFTESEFNRTGNSNANIGTDHAWGGHHIVFGGAVQRRPAYGTFPQHVAARARRCGRSRQLDSDDVARSVRRDAGRLVRRARRRPERIFPNLGNFSPQRLGFV